MVFVIDSFIFMRVTEFKIFFAYVLRLFSDFILPLWIFPRRNTPNIEILWYFGSRDVDPYSFIADPDPAVFLNADPDPA